MGEQPGVAEGDGEAAEIGNKERSSWIGPNGEDLWAGQLDDEGNVRVDIPGLDHGSKVIGAVFGSNNADFDEGLRWERAFRDGTHRGISAVQFERAYESVCFANYCGLVFNAQLTIAWSKLGIQKAHALRIEGCLRKFLERFRKWSEVRSLPAIYIAVMEGGPKVGFHTHFALRIPPEHASSFRFWLRGTLKTFLAPGTAWDPDVEEAEIRGDYVIDRQWTWIRYLLKDLDPRQELCYGPSKSPSFAKLTDIVGSTFTPKRPPWVYVDRVRVSENLGEAAQKKVGFKPLANVLDPAQGGKWTEAEFSRGLNAGMHKQGASS